ncbi:PfkB family carbohydrate kinase [Loktanella sp. TSTF-M6]|uniref:Ribokinase n=1 Tax=Loktanella gaetbuli TaxID=2881335 RepID=A0ABS8BXN7_9RHOB|nr:PfkB family carbohydrate kinase [Loktanella gaetbuli]MCB5200490.1 PfkB family carbohydrate kinase [Loktanella gaetbuli]
MKVFVVGNIALDQTLAVDRMPLEGESIFGSNISTDLGGKGTNQAIVLARCGITTILIAAIGADAQSRQMRDRLSREPVTARLIERSNISGDTTIVLKDAHGGNVNITTVDCARSLEIDDVRPLMEDAEPGDLVVLQGNLTVAATADIMREARARQLRLALNPSPLSPGIVPHMKGLDAIFLNEHEAEEITGLRTQAAVRYLQDLNIDVVVLTLGASGALLGSKDGVISVPAQKVSVADSTGAGDTFQSVAIGSALRRKAWIDSDALSKAAKASAITVSRFGTAAAFPSAAELEGLL